MKGRIAALLPVLILLGGCMIALTQETAQSPNKPKHAANAAAIDTQEKNLEEYIELLHTDVRPQKAQILGAVMQLDVERAKKFWPIYIEYDAECSKLNKLGKANIEEYARDYDQMTDSKADQISQNVLNYQKERSELLAKYYGLVKASLGPTEAARFLQIETQLLGIIDLQMESSLPTEQGS